MVCIDAAHYNFHTKDAGFFAFTQLLETDGYRVNGLDERIQSENMLTGCRILVIVNALNGPNNKSCLVPKLFGK